MAVRAIIEIDGTTATYTPCDWKCPNTELEKRLNAFERERLQRVSLYEPNRAHTAAIAAARQYNGKVIRVESL